MVWILAGPPLLLLCCRLNVVRLVRTCKPRCHGDEHGWARGQSAASWWPRAVDTICAQPAHCACAGRPPGRHQQQHAVHAVSRSLRHCRTRCNPRVSTAPMVSALAASLCSKPLSKSSGVAPDARADGRNRSPRIALASCHLTTTPPPCRLPICHWPWFRPLGRVLHDRRVVRHGDAGDGHGRGGAAYSSPRHPPHVPPMPHGASRSPRANPALTRLAVRPLGKPIVRYRTCWLVW